MTVPAPREQRGIDLDTCPDCGEPQAVCRWLDGCDRDAPATPEYEAFLELMQVPGRAS